MTDSASPVKPARVLVTGADGTIGRPVVEALLSAGISVTALSTAWSGPSPADRVFTGDAADETLVRQALEDADAVVHLAAIPHPGLGTAREVFVGNTSATFTVLNVAGEVGVRRAVIASSINAFGVPFNRHDLTPAYYPLDELSPVAHDDAYSLSKWVDEQTGAWAHSRWGITVVALRFPLVRDLPELREIAARLSRNPVEQVRLAREGWAYLAMADALDAVLRGLTHPISGMHTLLLAAEDTIVGEPTDLLLDRFAPTSERRRDFPGRTAPIDTSAARRVLGWVPRHRLGDPSGPINATFQETPA